MRGAHLTQARCRQPWPASEERHRRPCVAWRQRPGDLGVQPLPGHRLRMVSEHNDDRVIPTGLLLEPADQPSDILVGVAHRLHESALIGFCDPDAFGGRDVVGRVGGGRPEQRKQRLCIVQPAVNPLLHSVDQRPVVMPLRIELHIVIPALHPRREVAEGGVGAQHRKALVAGAAQHLGEGERPDVQKVRKDDLSEVRPHAEVHPHRPLDGGVT